MTNAKLISTKIIDGNEINIYRHPIIAGMQFCYTEGSLKNIKMRQIGHYDFEIITSNIGETISERTFNKVFYAQ